jgi:hypothetical protein
MIIGRHPLFSPITWIANKITTGEPYDKLFHLYMIVNTHKGSVLIGKNEVVNIARTNGPNSNDEIIHIHNFPHITIHSLLENTRKRMGDDFWTYQAGANNCQNFILNILEANDIHQAKIL